MTMQGFVQILRARRAIIFITLVLAILGSLGYSLATTPQYQASTRLFVSATSSANVSEIYEGNLFSQQRALSYVKILMGETLAQRTIDKLNLNMTAADLQEKVKASSTPDTVLIDVKVLDPSPDQARDIANTLSSEFVSMVAELETPELAARPDARVIIEQKATTPTAPVVPKTARDLGLAALFGLLVGIALAVLRDRFDNTMKTPEAVEAVAGVGVVASIPFDKNRRKEPLISFEGDHSAAAEAYRELRTNLHFLEVDNPPRVLVVTSSLPDEGKTFTSINLALALAEAGNNVVLVDGDLRRPRLAVSLDLVGPVGFSTVLAGRARLRDVVQTTAYPGLAVLTSGAIPPNPSELLGSVAAKNLLKELQAHYDYVVIDSSPLLAVTDPAVLAAAADGVHMMVRFGKTKREVLAHSVGVLATVGATFLGTVFTMTPTKGAGFHNYGYYGESVKPSSSPAKAPKIADYSSGPIRRRAQSESE